MADFLNINQILDYLELKENMLGAEFGCGSAGFAIALAKRLRGGKVYALDIQEEKISALKGRLAVQKIHNVHSILCDLEAANGSTLRDNSLDVVLIPNLLFQAENKNDIMKEAYRILKQGGQLLIIDWIKKTAFNSRENLTSSAEVKKTAELLSFSLKKEFTAGDYHYGLLFTKQ